MMPFIFLVVLFLYIHITSQWKTSDDMEIYESDYESPAQLQEVCSVKQPVVFHFSAANQEVAPMFDRFQTPLFEKYDNLDIRVKDVADFKSDQSVDYVPLSFRSARRLMTTNTNGKYFSEKNHDFLEESGLDRLLHLADGVLKPPLCAYKKYDLLIGSPHVKTPLRYGLESHCFLACMRGGVRVKLCPPKYGRILPSIVDYENYEFRSQVDPWSTSDKVKFLEVDLIPGDLIYLPAYWWYSLSYGGDADTTLAEFRYDVVMNVLAQSKHWGLYYLQRSNIKTKPARTLVSEDGEGPTAEEESLLRSADKEPLPSTDIHPSMSGPVPPTPPLEKRNEKRDIITNAGIYTVGGAEID
jgi:hypothetical protein